MSTITRDGVTWELRAPAEAHYSARWSDGHMLLHGNRNCPHLTEEPVVVSPKIVRTLWEKDATTGATANENDVTWCEECASRRAP